LCLVAVWCCGTLLGHRVGASIGQPEVFALDFAFVAVFTSLTVSLWRGKKDILPWLVAACLSIGAHVLLPGKWFIVIGGVGGALIGALAQGKPSSRRST